MTERKVRKTHIYSREPHEHHVRQRTARAYNFLREEGYPASEATQARAKHMALILFRVEDSLLKVPEPMKAAETIPSLLSDEVVVLLSQKIIARSEDQVPIKIVTDMFIEPDPAWAARTIEAFMFTPEDTTLQTS